MNDLFSVKGKIALVTGSTGGLGSVFAEGLAKGGAKVILNGRNEQKLDYAVKNLVAKGFTVYGYKFDVTNSDEIYKAVQSIEKNLGPVDILVNTAGINIRSPKQL